MKKIILTRSATFQPTIREWSMDLLDELKAVIGQPEVFTTTDKDGKETISRIKLSVKEDENGDVLEGYHFRNDDMDYVSEIIGTGKMTLRTVNSEGRIRISKYIVEDGYAHYVRFPGSTNSKRETRVL